MGGDGLAAELGGKAGGEVLKHDEADEDGVAGGPRGWSVAEDAELEWKVIVLGGDGGVDAARIELEIAELFGRKAGDGAVGGGAKLKDPLDAVVFEEVGTHDRGELARGVAAKEIHLEE